MFIRFLQLGRKNPEDSWVDGKRVLGFEGWPVFST